MLYCNNLLTAHNIDYVELPFGIRKPFNKRFCYKGNNVNEMLLLWKRDYCGEWDNIGRYFYILGE